MSVHDKFCWKCCTEGVNTKCTTCVRSFHDSCLLLENSEDNKTTNWVCPICVKIQLSATTDTKKELELIPLIQEHLWKSKTVEFFNSKKSVNYFKVHDSIVNPIDLSQIQAKIKSYRSIYEFKSDFEWFVHNCKIVYPTKHCRNKNAEQLMTEVAAECDSVKKCAQCHINANFHRKLWFSMVCDKPHLIIWAFMKNTTFWPAKVMVVNDRKVNVRFFGTYHKHEDVDVGKCYLFSSENPKKRQISNVKLAKSYQAAMEEAKRYINNIIQKFGAFNYAQPESKFDPKHLENYIRRIIPGTKSLETEQNANGETSNGILMANHQNTATVRIIKTEQNLSSSVPNESNTMLQPADEAPVLLERREMSKRVHPSTSNSGEPSSKVRNICKEETEMNDFENESVHFNDDDHDMDDEYSEMNSQSDETELDTTSMTAIRESVDNSMLNFSTAFTRVCKMNEMLQRKIEQLEANRSDEMKELEARNTLLETQIKQIINENRAQVISMKTEHEQELDRLNEENFLQMKNVKEGHKLELGAVKGKLDDTIAELDELKNKLDNSKLTQNDVDQAVNQWKSEYLQKIEIAKKHIYCEACGKEKPMGIHMCDLDCQRKYLEQISNKPASGQT